MKGQQAPPRGWQLVNAIAAFGAAIQPYGRFDPLPSASRLIPPCRDVASLGTITEV